MLVRFQSIIFCFFISCTIISDGDITTQLELAELNKRIILKSIEITQRQQGDSGTPVVDKKVSAATLKDAIVNIPSAAGTVTRFFEIDFPALTDIIRLKSELTTPVKLHEYFLSDGRPYSFKVVNNNKTLESYQFGYDNLKRLNKIQFFSPDATLITNDTLIYNSSGNVTNILRRFSNGSSQISIAFEYGGNNITRFIVQGYLYESKQEICYQTNGTVIECHGFQRYPNQGSAQPVQIMKVKSLINSNRLSEFSIEGDQLNKYYFHPLMILKNHFSNGSNLMIVHMFDWWNIGGEAGGFTEVKFKFNYGL